MSARNFFYHLKLELYDKPPEACTGEASKATSAQPCWLPGSGTDIFASNLPQHSFLPPEESSKEDITDRLGEDWARLDDNNTNKHSHNRQTASTLIDCGVGRRDGNYPRKGHANISPESTAAHKRTRSVDETAKDWRFAPIRVESIMIGAREPAASASKSGAAAAVSSKATSSGHTLGKVQPLTLKGTKCTELGWGIVHLYREGEETPGLNDATAHEDRDITNDGLSGLDTTVLCIPAVPSYMTASDFLGWVGEKTRDEVAHFRMVMTGRMNRYMMLMKFRDGAVARRWKKEWDGKVFNGMEPENCHVLFIKSIVFQTPSSGNPQDAARFPNMTNDPFTPQLSSREATSPTSQALDVRPLPPPTPALVELPTCPVCLERMDDTTGLLTILCQHVFHCACLAKWRGSGCPVCRHVQPLSSLSSPFGIAHPTRDLNLCQVCDTPDDLWICLICGNVGCGRYKGGHAKEHYKQTAHCFALEVETQYVWDYAGDVWVHRLIQTKGDGKLLELPSSAGNNNSNRRMVHAGSGREAGDEEMELVPRQKLEKMGEEFTRLLTSQLENQRVYFEEKLSAVADRAAASARQAEEAIATSERVIAEMKLLKEEQEKLTKDTVPSLERDRARLSARAEKSAELARNITKSFQEEKVVSKGLMERVEHLNTLVKKLQDDVRETRLENEDLKEQNRDLSFFISSKEKLESVDDELKEEIREGTLAVPEPKQDKKKKRGKGKGKEQGEGSK